MTRYSFFILSLFLGLLSASAAVPETVYGTIVDGETRQFLNGAVVQALNKQGKAIAFASSNTDGTFKIRVTEAVDSISFRCMGYGSLKLHRDYDFAKGVEMWPKATQLKDVIVQAPDIYAKGDTLVFNVSRYANASDNAIIDVIKRLPGIKVEEDGTIKYHGKPINKFYIDGDDFLEGQYGLATNNISHKDVKSVEVMENHQPVKALEGIEFPEEAGINIKLNEGARGKWVGVAKAGSGARPWLYDGSLYAMRIAPKVQNILTLRAGNTGWNPAEQITEHDFSDMSFTGYSEALWPEYIAADIINAPLNEKRTRDNLSWLANSITAWKRGDTSMRFKLNYVGDRLEYNSGLRTDYFSQSIPEFIQNNSLRTQRHDVSAQFNMQINKRGYFLKDKLTVVGAWENSRSAITGSFELDQRIRRRSLSAGNDLRLVKRNDKKLFELTFRNSFSHRPDRLFVLGEDDAVQNIGATDFRSTTESRWGKLGRFWKFYVNGGVDLNYHRMNTSLAGMTDFDNSQYFNAFLSNLYATPQLDYQRNGWLLSTKIQAKWLHHSVGNRHDYINLFPRVYARKKISAKGEVSASFSYMLSSPQAYMGIDVPVMSDYRNIFIANDIDKYSQNIAATVSYKYRNPLTSFFANASLTYNYRVSSYMSNQLFIDDFIISTYADRLSGAHFWSVAGGVSKGLGHSRMVVGFDVNVSTSSASSMRDNIMEDYSQQTLSVKPYFKGSLCKWLSVNYDANYGFSQLKIGGTDNRTHSFNQKFYATIMPHDRWQFTLGAEHFLTKFPEGNVENLALLDASAVWKAGSKLRLSLTANNLLDRRYYQYVTYGTLSRSEHQFQIRPRNILASIQYRF
ncbi:outer membrane beta-barrel protein [Muribaculum intestinale]|uniref:outer membrane beta-barrel protein n=1 Tax=Muribaculum intestinale TaxID=1796646 RepID=UPI001A296B17|nr:outer membrane beta-barrel protein [Muribaculum intestinale]MBJ2184048.1 TonB-dependent receptor [Muribaculaceae bacterium]